jgi:hypothetical protein
MEGGRPDPLRVDWPGSAGGSRLSAQPRCRERLEARHAPSKDCLAGFDSFNLVAKVAKPDLKRASYRANRRPFGPCGPKLDAADGPGRQTGLIADFFLAFAAPLAVHPQHVSQRLIASTGHSQKHAMPSIAKSMVRSVNDVASML